MSEKVNEILRLMEVRRSYLSSQNDPIKFEYIENREEMLNKRMNYHGASLVAADASSSAAPKDFKKAEEVHPQQDLHQQGLKKEEKEEEKKDEGKKKKNEDKEEGGKDEGKKKKNEDKEEKEEKEEEKKEFKHAVNNVDKLSVNPKEIDPAITKAKESIETNKVFDASTTSFFKGYGIAAGHAEDEFGGLGLIGVFEEPKTSDGIRTANHSIYLFLFIILASWFLFNNKIYK